MTYEQIEELKLTVDIVDVVSNFVDLERKGSNYIGLCPFHSENRPSFNVSQSKGIYKCFGCGASGDVIEFLKEMGNTFKDSLQILKGEKLINGVYLQADSIKAPVADFHYIKPTKHFELEDYKHHRYGYPNNIYEYYNIDNHFIGSVLRFNLADGTKYTPPFNSRICITAGYNSQRKGKGCGKYYEVGDTENTFSGFDSPKPLYGIHKLTEDLLQPIIFVEGEKVRDFLDARLLNSVVVSCTGGTNNAKHTDFSLFKGRTIYLIPDNDWSKKDKDGVEKIKYEQPSIKFMLELMSIFEKDNTVIYINSYNRELPDGWDLADTNWDAKQITDFILSNQIQKGIQSNPSHK
jgi:hypothetical protein